MLDELERYVSESNASVIVDRAVMLKLIAAARAAEAAVDGLSVGLVHTLDRFCGTETSDAIEIRKLRDSLRQTLAALKGPT